ncbi:MAG: DUF4279 domain-containing protein [Verrucomicrobia bacterium]|nr:DUF4279 domain-containing protein [Verrucomicrobiota bacterium]
MSVHRPILVDGQPLIARADTTREPDAYYFYFRLEDEPYYLVVVVRREGDKLAVTCACVEAAVRVYLLVKSKHLTPREITERLGLQPTRAYAKGDRIHAELPPLTYTKWRFEPHQTLAEEIGRKLDLLLDVLEPATPRIAKLASEADVKIGICYEGCREWLGGWDTSSETLRRLAALGVHLQFDLYASGPDLPEPDLPGLDPSSGRKCCGNNE